MARSACGWECRHGQDQTKKGQTMESTLNKTMLAGAVAASVAVMSLTGCVNTSERSAGRQLDDRIVNSKVKDALNDAPVYKFPEVRTMTYGGVVQLSGFVSSEDQKRQAAELARKVEGVHEVINNISLKPTATGRETGYPQGKLDADVKVDAKTSSTNDVNRSSTEGAPVRENK